MSIHKTLYILQDRTTKDVVGVYSSAEIAFDMIRDKKAANIIEDVYEEHNLVVVEMNNTDILDDVVAYKTGYEEGYHQGLCDTTLEPAFIRSMKLK